MPEKKPISQGLELIIRLIKNNKLFNEKYFQKYGVNIKNACMNVIKTEKIHADCKTKAYYVLIILFQTKSYFKHSLFDDNEVKKFVDHLMSELCNEKKSTPMVLQKIYELWGVLGEHYETYVSSKAGQIMRNMVFKLKNQTNSREDVNISLLTGIVTGLTGLMVNFSPDGMSTMEDMCSSNTQHNYLVTIYESIKILSVFDPHHTRRMAHRAALKLFERHLSLFLEYIFPNNVIWWHENLRKWIYKLGEDRKAGIAVSSKFQEVIAYHLSCSEGPTTQKIFQYFVRYYKNTLESSETPPQELTLAIQGFGSLSRACNNLLSSKDVEVMFSLVLQRVQQSLMREDSENEKYENLADFIESLSNISREIKNMSEGQLGSMEKLCILGISSFPTLLPRLQPNIIKALKINLINIALVNGNMLDSFLSTVVYQGVVRTCSHIGLGLQGAEIQVKEEALSNIVTYKSYMPLWRNLLDLARDQKLLVKTGASSKLLSNISDKLYDEMIKTLLSLIDKLNVSVEIKTQDICGFSDIQRDTEFGVGATSPGDITVLLNLADLYSELFLPASPQINKWIPKLVYNLITKSVSFPIIGGFYKLLTFVLKAADELQFFFNGYPDDDREVEWTGQYITKFLEDVVIKLQQYKGDLQISCLQTVMVTPIKILEPLLELITPTLLVVFSVGRSFLELAHKGMDALERWQKSKEIPVERLNKILVQVLPSFDPFLRSRGCFENLDSVSKIHIPRSQMKRQKLLTEESELTKLQKRMLLFLSCLDTPTCLSLLDQELTAVGWSSDKFLSVMIPFPDVNINIYLDDLLPRVIELALSSDRTTRSAAGELLHAIIMVILAKGLEVERLFPESLIQVFQHLAPALLQLGSHSDLLTYQLFHPLVIQITHWLSSKWMYVSSLSDVFLEAVWDGLTHITETGVREFSAECLREFVSWSIKQLSDADLEKHQLNVKAVTKQINTYCLHPSPHKRFGAALAFNNLYKILREHNVLIDVFWLELFYHFLRNLALSDIEDTDQTLQALDHLERVVREKSDLLNKVFEKSRRRVPQEVKGPLLKDFLNWLVEQCASTHKIFRKKCMSLIQNLARHIPGCDMVSEFLQGSQMTSLSFSVGFGTYFLQPRPSSGCNVSMTSVTLWLNQLLASLDCYEWMVRQGFKQNVNLLSPGKSSFFEATEYLIMISLASATSVLEDLREEMILQIDLSPKEEHDFKLTKCKVIIQLFKFVTNKSCIDDLPDDFWSSDWWKLVGCCILTPNKVGFGIITQHLLRNMAEIMLPLLETLSINLNHRLHYLFMTLNNIPCESCESVCEKITPILKCGLNITEELKNQICGFTILQKSGLFSSLHMASSWNGEVIMIAIFSGISDSQGQSVELTISTLNFVQSLINFAFLLEVDVYLTLHYMLDNTSLTDCKTFSKTTSGEYFTRLFKSQLFEYLLADTHMSYMDYLFSELNQYSVDLITLLLKYCEYSPTASTKKWRTKDFIVKLSSCWNQLEVWAGNDTGLQQKLVDIATCASKCYSVTNGCFCYSDQTRPIYTWILSNIGASKEVLCLRSKIKFLALLPTVARDTETDSDLMSTLNSLKSEHFPLTYSEFNKDSIEAGTYQLAFQQMLSALVQSSNLDILRCIISETRTDEDHPCKEDIQKSLSSFIRKLSLQKQSEVLDTVFEIFNVQRHTGRLIVLHIFLIPLIKAALPNSVINFFSKTINWILNNCKENLEIRDLNKAKEQLQRKIGAFTLIGTMFGSLNNSDFSTQSKIIQASGMLEEKKLAKILLKISKDVRMLVSSFDDSTYTELFRLFQCSAYKAVISIISNGVWNTVDVYRGFIFEETPNQKIWCHIVPMHTEFSFPVDFDTLPKRKKQLIEIKTTILKSEVSSNNRSFGSLSVLSSPSPFLSTLTEDITKYDFTGYSLRSCEDVVLARETKENLGNIVVELSTHDLNQHECMATLCGVVNFITKSNFYPLPENDQDLKLPPWMDALRKSLESVAQHKNNKIYIIKLILNCENCFHPYAKFWFAPIIQCIIDKCLGNDINYMIADVIVMLTKWRDVAKPNRSFERFQVKSLLEFLIKNCPKERNDIFKHNFHLISLVLFAWEPSVPYELLLQITTPPLGTKSLIDQRNIEIGLKIACHMLMYDCFPFEETEKSRYYAALLANLQNTDKTVIKLCADIIGRIFKKIGELSGEDQNLFEEVCTVLRQNIRNDTIPGNLDRFILCLYGINKHYEVIGCRFVVHCKDLLPSLPPSGRVSILEVLNTISNYNFIDLMPIFLDFLKKDHEETIVAVLKLIQKQLPLLEDKEEVLIKIFELSEHANGECREVVYKITQNYYERKVATKDSNRNIFEACKEILIKGLVDTDVKLQEQVYRFWNEAGKLSPTTSSRFVNVTSALYSPKEEYHFLSTALCLFLESAVTNPYSNNTKVFSNPLTNCTFEPYNMTTDWRAQHTLLAPMFAQTISSYIPTLISSSQSANVRATPSSLAFAPTLQSDDGMMDVSSSSSTSSTFLASQTSVRSQSQNSDNDIGVFAEPKWIRCIRSKEKISRSMADRNIQENVKRQKMMAERHKKRDAQVTLVRSYRIGDFPDIEIKYIDLIKPLQLLVKRDSIIARQVFVLFYKSLNMEPNISAEFSSAVNNILQTSTQYEPSAIASILEVLIESDDFSIDYGNITKVCKNSKLLPLGSILLEKRLLADKSEPPPAKRARGSSNQLKQQNLWVQLAEIYRSLGEADIVKGIFEGEMASSCGSEVQNALRDESIGYWDGALESYNKAIKSAGNSDVMNDFLFEASFKCCEYMADWDSLKTNIKDQVNDLNDIWNDSWSLDHYLPWLFTSEINEALIGRSDPKDFIAKVHEWASEANKEDHMKNRIGESLCIIYLIKNDMERSKLYSDNNLMQFIENWTQLDNLQRKLRAHKLFQLQLIMEIHHFVSLPLEFSKWRNSVKELLHHWSNNSASDLDSLSNWEARALYRHFFANKFESQLNEDSKNELKNALLSTQLSLIDCAIKQKNYHFAKKYIPFAHKQVKGFENDLTLRFSQAKLLEAQLYEGKEEVELTIGATNCLSDVINNNLHLLTPTLQIKFYRQVAQLCSCLEMLLIKDPSMLTEISSKAVYELESFIGIQERHGDEDFAKLLHEKAFNNLNEAVKIANVNTEDSIDLSNITGAYFELAKFASQGQHKNETVMIESLLKAMKFGSCEARQLFPSLLQLSTLTTTNATLFKEESELVPEWMFLQWVPQLLSSLDSSNDHVLGDLLARITKCYPAAILFPFHLSCEMFENSPNKPQTKTIERLSSLLPQAPSMKALVDALTCLNKPNNILLYHLKKLKDDINNNLEIIKTYQILNKDCFVSEDDAELKGELFKSNTKYKVPIEQVIEISRTDQTKALIDLNKLIEEVSKEKRTKGDLLLKNYSPFLDSFSQIKHGNLEIPGQYTGTSRPIPGKHIMISGFKSQVKIMQSLTSPVRITIIGNDGKERHYLVKFGEDLRQDQRIQQLFGVMNQTLITNLDTSSRGLSIDTYAVVPLNTRSGLIAWVYDTIPLKQFILKSDPENLNEADLEYQKWFYCNRVEKNPFLMYKMHSKEETVQNFTRIKNILPEGLLRNSVNRMASSPEAFFYLRFQMLTSHAVLCICHWLLGIGDRHLENILVSTKTGRFLGIDFGHAFDTAVALPIPELIPFRMTPQIENLAAPLYIKGCLQESMVYTLQALRFNNQILLNTMDVFIKEPTILWLSKISQKDHASEEYWYPQNKINTARRKLEGDHPCHILISELESSHKNDPLLPYFTKLVLGVEENIRTSYDETNLTAREQVQCLLDQATDKHILGKTYFGWHPFV